MIAAGASLAGSRVGASPAELVHREGSLRLLRYRPAGRTAAPVAGAPPLLLVLPLINRGAIVDLTPSTSLVAALAARGVDTFVLDWGAPTLADRTLGLDGYVGRLLPRCQTRALAAALAPRLVLAGYCLGGTLAAIRAALASAAGEGQRERIAGLISLNAPVSFEDAGMLGAFAARERFPLEALLDAFANVPGALIQAGFHGLKPLQGVQKLRRLLHQAADPRAVEEFLALELWNADNVDLTAAFYRTLIEDLHRDDRLVRGTLRVSDTTVDLAAIRCPTLVIAAEDDPICLPAQARALLGLVSSAARSLVLTRGGHIRSVIGAGARERVADAMAGFVRACTP